jgi:predicted DNA-binding transcriptional regulator AlpA
VLVRVKLPPDPLLEFWHFCDAIAAALCPLVKRDLVGIECVVGKQVTRQISVAPTMNQHERWPVHMGLQRTLLSEDGFTLEEMLRESPETPDAGAELQLDVVPRREVVELPSVLDLDDEDLRVLEALLPHLPALRHPLSPLDEEAFLSAYRDTPGRPAWTPVLVTAADIKRRELEQDGVRDQHRRALQAEFAVGRLTAVNGRNAPVPVLTTGSFIPRMQALAYLDRCGLAYADDAADAKAHGNKQSKQPKRGVASTAMPQPEQLTQTSRVVTSLSASPSADLVDEGAASDIGQPVSGSLRHPLEVASRPQGKVARLKRVCELTGLGRSSIYNRMDAGSKHFDPTFPRSFSLGSDGGAVGWNEEEINAWVAARRAARPE